MTWRRRFSEKGSKAVPYSEFVAMFHGRNERIDQTSLGLMVDLWEGTARELLG